MSNQFFVFEPLAPLENENGDIIRRGLIQLQSQLANVILNHLTIRVGDGESPMSNQRTNCPDCEAELRPIKLLDATNQGMSSEGTGHVEQAYAVENARASWFTQSVPKTGTVKAKICPGCGRIILFGSSRKLGIK